MQTQFPTHRTKHGAPLQRNGQAPGPGRAALLVTVPVSGLRPAALVRVRRLHRRQQRETRGLSQEVLLIPGDSSDPFITQIRAK